MKTYKFAVGAAAAVGLMFGSAVFAQSASVLNVSGSFPASVSAGAQNATVASMTLSNPSATAPLAVHALPIAFSNMGLVSNCRFENTASPGTSLSSGINPGTTNIVSLTSPLSIAAGGSVTLTVVCAVAPNPPAGTMLGVAFLPSNILAMSGGATTTPIGVGLPAGAPFVAEVAIIGGTGTPPPGLPPTGSGGNAPLYYALFALAAAAVAAGAWRLRAA